MLSQTLQEFQTLARENGESERLDKEEQAYQRWMKQIKESSPNYWQGDVAHWVDGLWHNSGEWLGEADKWLRLDSPYTDFYSVRACDEALSTGTCKHYHEKRLREVREFEIERLEERLQDMRKQRKKWWQFWK